MVTEGVKDIAYVNQDVDWVILGVSIVLLVSIPCIINPCLNHIGKVGTLLLLVLGNIIYSSVRIADPYKKALFIAGITIYDVMLIMRFSIFIFQLKNIDHLKAILASGTLSIFYTIFKADLVHT